ncbi:hypothetical protein LCGC14_2893010, partial [marine sediment metagenome]
GADNTYEVEVTASDGANTDVQTITVTVTDVGEGGPVIADLGGDTVAFTEDGEAIYIDNGSNASVSDGGGTDYNGGYLLIHRQANFTANDTLSIDINSDSDADNTTGIYVSGSEVRYDNVAIGDIGLDGTGSNDLRIDFGSAAANDAAVGALLQAIQFNNSGAPPDTTNRIARITLNNSADTSADNDVTITVAQNLNNPVITSDGGAATAGVNAAENQTAVTTVTATDADGSSPTFTITGGEDQAKFGIDLNSGVLTFGAAPDYEVPTDVGANNTYIVEVTAGDGANTDVQTITVTVTNVNEEPVITSDPVTIVQWGQKDGQTDILTERIDGDADTFGDVYNPAVPASPSDPGYYPAGASDSRTPRFYAAGQRPNWEIEMYDHIDGDYM